MKKLSFYFFVGLLMLSCQPSDKKTASESVSSSAVANITEPVRDGIFIHITESYNDPHKVLMPLKMATLMADDKDVLVYMDIHAVEILVKNAKELKMDGFESAQTYINELVAKKVGIYACPTCLKIAGFTPEDLLPGVQTAQKDKFFNFTKGRILALDY